LKRDDGIRVARAIPRAEHRLPFWRALPREPAARRGSHPWRHVTVTGDEPTTDATARYFREPHSA